MTSPLLPHANVGKKTLLLGIIRQKGSTEKRVTSTCVTFAKPERGREGSFIYADQRPSHRCFAWAARGEGSDTVSLKKNEERAQGSVYVAIE